MDGKQDICPHCGGTELVRGQQYRLLCYGAMAGTGRRLIHLICRRCGTVVRSYVEDPEYFAE